MNPSLLVWLLLSVIWGSTFLFIKLGLADLPPFTFAAMRFSLALLPLGVMLLVRRDPTPRPRSRRDWRLMIWTGVLTFSVTYGLVYWGENHITVGLTSILFVTMPLFTLIIAHFMLDDEPLSWAKLGGVLLGIVGVVVIFYNQIQFESVMALWGSLAILGASLVSAFTGVWVKRDAGHLDPTLLTVVQLLAGLLPLWALGLWLEGDPRAFDWTTMAWTSLFYLAWVGTALPFVLFYWLIKRIPVVFTMLIGLSITLVAVLLGWRVLGEALGWHTWLGAAAILAGLAITVWVPRRG